MNKNFVIFHPFVQKPPVDGFAPNLAQPYSMRVAAVIISNKFLRDRSRGVDSVGGSKIAFSH